MSMLHSMQAGYSQMRRKDVTVADTLLDGKTAARTYSDLDRPSYAFEIGPEYNGAEIFFTMGYDYVRGVKAANCDGSSEKGAGFTLFGYAGNGPTMKIVDGTINVGQTYLCSTTASADATHGFYCSSIHLGTDYHATTVTVAGADSTLGVAKMFLDSIGYTGLIIQFPDISGAPNAWIRPY